MFLTYDRIAPGSGAAGRGMSVDMLAAVKYQAESSESRSNCVYAVKADYYSVFDKSCHAPQKNAFTAAEEVLGLDSHEAQPLPDSDVGRCLPRNGKLSHNKLGSTGRIHNNRWSVRKPDRAARKYTTSSSKHSRRLCTSEEVPEQPKVTRVPFC